MEIFFHINYLLQRNNFIIVPEIGTFILEKKEAKINYEKEIIIPPYERIIFNQSLSYDDGLIAASFARKNKISFGDAKKAVYKEVSYLRDSLMREGFISFKDLGKIKLNKEGRLRFEPLEINHSNRKKGLNEISYS